MRCPYLSCASKRECVKMVAESMEGDLSEFDLKHFCDGNPIYCYYFRLSKTQPDDRFQKAITIGDADAMSSFTSRTVGLDTPLRTDQQIMHKTEP